MQNLILVLLVSLSYPAFSQGLINKEKRFVKRALEQDVKRNPGLNIIITDQDSLITYSVRDENYKPVDFIYRFDQSGKCRSQKVMAGCDSCFRKYLQEVLANKKYEWKKINENQYISRYNAYLVLELPPEKNDYSYIIIKTEWNKETYKMLTGN